MKKFRSDALSIFTGLALAVISFYSLKDYSSKPTNAQIKTLETSVDYIENYKENSDLDIWNYLDNILESTKKNQKLSGETTNLEKKIQEIPSEVKTSNDPKVYRSVLHSLSEDIREICYKNKRNPGTLFAGSLTALISGFFFLGAPYLFNSEEEKSYKNDTEQNI